jgi:TonB family protein
VSALASGVAVTVSTRICDLAHKAGEELLGASFRADFEAYYAARSRYGVEVYMAIVPEARQTELEQMHTYEHQQRRRMLVALLVLLLALVLVLVKDRQVLFPAQSVDSETGEPEPLQSPSPVVSGQAPALSVPQAVEAKKSDIHRPQRKPIVATILPNLKPSGPPIVVATSRALLPPLQVEVVAGNQRHPVDTGTTSVSVKMQDGISPLPQAATGAPVNASERVQLSPDAAQVISHPVDPSYPLLAKQMKVQGAVVLEALISSGGSIQEIQVLSGPAILSAAAREAVRQWRFKPYMQSGRPVDSEARITVNFTISTY